MEAEARDSGTQNTGSDAESSSSEDVETTTPSVVVLNRARGLMEGRSGNPAPTMEERRYTSELREADFRGSRKRRRIPRGSLEKGRVSDRLVRVWVSRTVEPGEFYAYGLAASSVGWAAAQTELRREMESLARDLDEYYGRESNRECLDLGLVSGLLSRPLSEEEIRAGGAVAAVTKSAGEESGGGAWPGRWSRVEVVEVESCANYGRNVRLGARADPSRSAVVGDLSDLHRILLRVRFVDSGGSVWRRLEDVFAMPPRFSSEPAMVVTCALSGVRPLDGDCKYSPAACQDFRRLVYTDLPSFAILHHTHRAGFPSKRHGTMVVGLELLEATRHPESVLETADPDSLVTVSKLLCDANLVLPFH